MIMLLIPLTSLPTTLAGMFVKVTASCCAYHFEPISAEDWRSLVAEKYPDYKSSCMVQLKPRSMAGKIITTSFTPLILLSLLG